MNIERKITMRHTQRNIERIHKWLKIKSDFKGFFSRDNTRLGYKICGIKTITFVFCN